MLISFGKKFTSIHLDEIVNQYWVDSKNVSEKEVIQFDLRQIEWIALEEITFLFGWFRFLLLNNKNIKILLPDYNKNFKTHNVLKNLWGKWQIFSFYYTLLDGRGTLQDYFNVDNRINNIIDEQIRKELFNQESIDDDVTVVPFQAISASGYGDIKSIDSFVINKVHKPLNLAGRVYEVLEKHAELSKNENILLSKIIANELFLNVIHHAIGEKGNPKLECYFAISLKRKFTKEAVFKSESYKKSFSNLFMNPSSDISEIKLNDEAINKKLEFYLTTILSTGYETERCPETQDYFKNKSNDTYKYRNETFIEFTFLDFGVGIPVTLQEDFKVNITHPIVRQQFNNNAFKQPLATQILEYAFLLNSSRHPFDIEIQAQYEIPRGLYYLIDIVRRYSGLVVARSRTGKVIYDFSIEVDEIKDAVRYADNPNLPDFEGTLISVIIPASQTFSDKVGKIRPAYKLAKSNKVKSNYYFALIDLVDQIEQKSIDKHIAKTPLQYIYHEIFNVLNQILIAHKDKPSLLIFDCAGFNIFPIKHKLLHFFSSSPNITEITNVVLLNFNDLDIIQDAKNSIAYKLNRSLNSNFLYKPIPIINGEGDIYWVGVLNEEDEAKLNELLSYDEHFIAKSDLTAPQIYSGSFLSTDKYGNIRSTIMTKYEILKFSKHES